MLANMVIREAKAEDWPAIWPILKEVGNAGETLTWDPARTEARARSGWMRELPGAPLSPWMMMDVSSGARTRIPFTRARGHTLPMPALLSIQRGAVRAQAGLCAGMSLTRHAQNGYRAMQFNAVVETNTRRSGCGRSFGFEILATVPEAFSTRRTDTSASISCTGGSETSRRTLFGMCARGYARIAGMLRAYCVVAALNLITSSAGTRPRSFTSMPCALAHSRTSVLSTPSARARRPLGPAAGHRLPLAVPLAHSARVRPAAPWHARRSGRSHTRRRPVRSGRCPQPRCHQGHQ